MNILSVDTSLSCAAAAVVSDHQLLAETLFKADRTLSLRLVPELEHLLALAGLAPQEIDLFAASLGPGSFTGVRAGIATIQGLALATGKPCLGFSTLAMLAMNLPCAAAPVCTLLDARKNEVYAALYDTAAVPPRPIIPECVMPPEQFLDRVTAIVTGPVICIGDGAIRYECVISRHLGSRLLPAPPGHQEGRASCGAVLARHTFDTGSPGGGQPAALTPVYLRPLEAEYAKLARQPGGGRPVQGAASIF
jgi:tRNA threonylcarbamoyladenosine biosynthesis protein TsaB